MRGLALAGALALAACSGKPSVVEPGADGSGARVQQIYVVSHGWHTGLVLPAGSLEAVAPELAQRFGPVAWYEVGWGDAGFYQAREITAGLTLRALFRSPGTVLHVAGVPADPVRQFPHSEVVGTCLTGREMTALAAYVGSSFERDPEGRTVALGAGIYGDSQFYAGVGGFHLLNTCNKWTAKGLRSAGLQLAPALRLTAGSVMGFLRAHRRDCSVPDH